MKNKFRNSHWKFWNDLVTILMQWFFVVSQTLHPSDITVIMLLTVCNSVWTSFINKSYMSPILWWRTTREWSVLLLISLFWQVSLSRNEEQSHSPSLRAHYTQSNTHFHVYFVSLVHKQQSDVMLTLNDQVDPSLAQTRLQNSSLWIQMKHGIRRG